jgi:hypothetical protein
MMAKNKKKMSRNSKTITVRGYRRKDGTRVHGYTRHTAR